MVRRRNKNGNDDGGMGLGYESSYEPIFQDVTCSFFFTCPVEMTSIGPVSTIESRSLSPAVRVWRQTAVR